MEGRQETDLAGADFSAAEQDSLALSYVFTPVAYVLARPDRFKDLDPFLVLPGVLHHDDGVRAFGEEGAGHDARSFAGTYPHGGYGPGRNLFEDLETAGGICG